ncbi:MAG: hypothetical protein AB2L11_10245 [Syntrophobacteraceae bacterium]
MLERKGDLILNQSGNTVALIDECGSCILINRSFWNDRGIRTKVSELAGGVKKHLVMPHEIYVSLSEKTANDNESLLPGNGVAKDEDAIRGYKLFQSNEQH